MTLKIFSAAILGLDTELVEVESDLGGGDMGVISIVGLPDMAVSESKERVRSAIKNSSLHCPKVKITVNLAPADLKKHGPSYDLPIAISILSAANIIKISQENLNKMMFLGELSLGGELRGINGILPITLFAYQNKIKTIFVPEENAKEAKLIDNIEVIGVKNLRELVDHINGIKLLKSTGKTNFNFSKKEWLSDMSHIKGQEQVKRAMEIVAAGAHNMLMFGPPGSGKTLIARTMPSILPELNLQEALEITKIYSISGLLSKKESLINIRPFRSPHHTASGAALVGGGTWPKPGEISLAHRGVLFLDEFGEFPRKILENLRQPLEDGIINISRAAFNLTFPAKFILLAAMNPCPCGFYGDKKRTCTCSMTQISNYNKKISGPILDRIDLHIEVPRIDFDKLSSLKVEETSESIRKRIQVARNIQEDRFKNTKNITNSDMSSHDVKKFCEIDLESKKIMERAVKQLHLSARAYFRILKLARTIADLENEEKILTKHLAEAIQYREKNKV